MIPFDRLTLFQKAAVVLAAFLISQAPAIAEEYQAEVIGVEGGASSVISHRVRKTVEEGSLLKAGDAVEVNSRGTVLIALDRENQNTLTLEGGSKAEIASVYPTEVRLEEGGVYSKLKKLPKSSSFKVVTPTALAVVRGTEYRTVIEEGETKVFNFSDSPVEVFGKDAEGRIQPMPLILKRSEAIDIPRGGGRPGQPRIMKESEMQTGRRFAEKIERKELQRGPGRHSPIQDIATVERDFQMRPPQDRQFENGSQDRSGEGPPRRPFEDRQRMDNSSNRPEGPPPPGERSREGNIRPDDKGGEKSGLDNRPTARKPAPRGGGGSPAPHH